MTSVLGWTWRAAAGFILAVLLWQGWRDIGLDRWANAVGWRLAWLPTVYIVGGLAVATSLAWFPRADLRNLRGEGPFTALYVGDCCAAATASPARS